MSRICSFGSVSILWSWSSFVELRIMVCGGDWHCVDNDMPSDEADMWAENCLLYSVSMSWQMSLQWREFTTACPSCDSCNRDDRTLIYGKIADQHQNLLAWCKASSRHWCPGHLLTTSWLHILCNSHIPKIMSIKQSNQAPPAMYSCYMGT